jgi:hypothetical protein
VRHSCCPHRSNASECANAGTLAWVRVVITEIAGDGNIRCRALDTSGLTDAGRWENLIEQALAIPPPYRADPGRPVYVLHDLACHLDQLWR